MWLGLSFIIQEDYTEWSAHTPDLYSPVLWMISHQDTHQIYTVLYIINLYIYTLLNICIAITGISSESFSTEECRNWTSIYYDTEVTKASLKGDTCHTDVINVSQTCGRAEVFAIHRANDWNKVSNMGRNLTVFWQAMILPCDQTKLIFSFTVQLVLPIMLADNKRLHIDIKITFVIYL